MVGNINPKLRAELEKKYSNLNDDDIIEFLGIQDKTGIHIQNEINAKEKQLFNICGDILSKYRNLEGLYSIFIKEASLLLDYKNKIENYEIDDSASEIGINFNRLVVNLISNTKLVVEFTEQIINKNCPSSSKELKNEIHKMYDFYFSYRFFYNLRNYCQHRGLPISSIEMVASDNDSKKKRKIRVLFKVSTLTESYKWKKVILTDFENIDDEFELFDLFDDYFKSVVKIYGKGMEIYLKENHSKLEELVMLLDKYEGIPMLCKIKKKNYLKGEVDGIKMVPLSSKYDIHNYYLEMSKLGLAQLEVIN